LDYNTPKGRSKLTSIKIHQGQKTGYSLRCALLLESHMIIQKTDYPLSISDQLVSILSNEIEQHRNINMASGCIINFRDPDFSAERGIYHPVEICLNELGQFQTITNFAYAGDGHDAELVKELDFDFAGGLFQHKGRDYPLSFCAELFTIWQSNFCAYYLFNVFQVTIQGPF
jgi:hypothetical protein